MRRYYCHKCNGGTRVTTAVRSSGRLPFPCPKATFESIIRGGERYTTPPPVPRRFIDFVRRVFVSSLFPQSGHCRLLWTEPCAVMVRSHKRVQPAESIRVESWLFNTHRLLSYSNVSRDASRLSSHRLYQSICLVTLV